MVFGVNDSMVVVCSMFFDDRAGTLQGRILPWPTLITGLGNSPSESEDLFCVRIVRTSGSRNSESSYESK
jgi:hypothetical protein